MPVVPRYDAQVAPGISQATQNIQASPDAFGAAQGRALQSVSQGFDLVAQRAEQIQNERDDVSAREAFIGASGRLRERMRGENGYLTRQGQDAFDGYNDFAAEVDNIGSEYAQGLSPQARRAYEQLWANRREGALSSGATHAANQRNAYNQTVFEGQMAETRNNVIEEYGNPAVFSAYLQSGADAVRARMNAQGIRDTTEEGRDAIAAAVDGWRSETIRMAVSSALDNGDIETAERLFEANEELLVGADRENARALIRQEGMIEEHQAAAADIFQQFGTDIAGARRYIRENYSGQEEDQMISRVEGLVSEQEEQQRDAREASAEQLYSLFASGATIDDVPPSLRGAFFALPAEVREAMAEGHALYSDPELRRALDSMTPEELGRHDIPSLMGRLSEADFNRYSGYIRSAREGVVSAERATTSQINDRIREGQTIIAPTDGLSGEALETARREQRDFEEYVHARIEQLDNPSHAEIREIIAEAETEYTIREPGWVANRVRTVRGYELQQQGQGESGLVSGAPEWAVDVMSRVNRDMRREGEVFDVGVASEAYRQISRDFREVGATPTQREFEEAYRLFVADSLAAEGIVSPLLTTRDRDVIAGDDEDLSSQARGLEAIEAFRRLNDED